MIEGQKVDLYNEEWKRINMRSVAHALGAEFVHDLYNRYDPKINAIRFRHTVTIWKDGTLNSYAPAKEWDRLGAILSAKFFALHPGLIKYTKLLYARKREHFHSFICELEETNLSSLTNTELATLLVDFQSLVLGELYVLNFVQVEHGLNMAVKKVLKELDPAEADHNFSALIHTNRPTESQREKRHLSFIALKWRLLRSCGLYNEERARRDVAAHSEMYRYLYSAYGEEPRALERFWAAFTAQLEHPLEPLHLSLYSPLLAKESRELLRSLNNKKLNVLVPLLVEGGMFRDTNKALLGLSMRYRFDMLDEVARREYEKREHLNFYLLSEIVDLLNEKKKLSTVTLAERKEKGIVFTRYEDMETLDEDKFSFVTGALHHELKGDCASRGEAVGACKIVLSKKDTDKVEKGDIMVAIGTDFDLIDAMYRAAAVITEESGILSHASVVCRELKKPCCIGVKHATRLLRDGERVSVNATKGTITTL